MSARALPLIAATLLLSACGQAGAGSAEPPVAPQGDVPQSALPDAPQPPRTYANACGTCHDNGGFGVRVLADRLGPENALIHERNQLDPDTIRAVVRNGMGHMPAMSKVEVSDAELDEIIAFLGTARAEGEAP